MVAYGGLRDTYVGGNPLALKALSHRADDLVLASGEGSHLDSFKVGRLASFSPSNFSSDVGHQRVLKPDLASVDFGDRHLKLEVWSLV
jgi:hypothetical protein